MAEWLILDDETVLRAAEKLVAAEPLLAGVPGEQVAAALGWPVTRHEPGRSIVLDPGYGFGPTSVFVSLDRSDQARSIIVNLSVYGLGLDPEPTAYRRDVFARAAAALTGALGEPSRRITGEHQELWWDRGDAVLRLILGPFAVLLQLSRIDDAYSDD